jgi:hypothetical protein
MHHIKFEKNWSSGYKEQITNIQMFGPALGAKPLCQG